MGVLAVGSVALDSVKTPFGNIEDALGGSATFFSIAASYFTDVSIVAVAGSDFPAEHMELFKSCGIDTTGLTVEDGETFRWSGVYGYDLNDRETIDTRLNVFERFCPVLPESGVNSEFLFLANIDPDLQNFVLKQVTAPRLVACDTMNFWIEGKKAALLDIMKRVDMMILNDYECRELAGEPNLITASRAILGMGPSTAIVKKGEHGVLMTTSKDFFSAPAYPCESVFDPTGAGDSFAGGFMGHLAATGDTSAQNIRRAVIYGTVMASFCVERFSVGGMTGLNRSDIERRFHTLKQLSHFEP
ncbi:MAG: sugar kinase [Candidatus Anoxymicrobium japonicum]|uniref:Sugar kinase n=1 Tax=Candidatus Anoxymicrobium japonicum TaxID=2013648 RepID=A0A2N3G708_9ACTN|nr:MAG: sugar kinase [Candidatus Anoxymicrobium japonicum]